MRIILPHVQEYPIQAGITARLQGFSERPPAPARREKTQVIRRIVRRSPATRAPVRQVEA